jgi:uncharacterized ferritin-like protein (DUF455 family)
MPEFGKHPHFTNLSMHSTSSPEISTELPTELRSAALALLCECDATAKVAGTRALFDSWAQGRVRLDVQAALSPHTTVPGRPALPVLVPPREVVHRSMGTAEGQAAMVHAMAHIEFNAINLALDALWRFDGMPREYYADWLLVASEEALHFSLLAAHLQTLGFPYGCFSAHNSLWDMVEKTQHDVLARMALVPRTMEARGLDASPAVRAKLAQAGDMGAAVILDRILQDEVGHVLIGNRWYGWLCAQRGLEPVATYAALAKEFKAPVMRGPFNLPARRAAGFSEAELEALRAP